MFARSPRAFLCVALLLATACGGGSNSSSNPTAPSAGVPFSQTDLRVGTGADAVAGRRVTVAYTLWLYDAAGTDRKGRQIESNATGFAFTLGTGAVIRGWDVGISGMKVGGQRRLIIPPDLAYGSAGSGPIPGNATLVFDVELLAVQ